MSRPRYQIPQRLAPRQDKTAWAFAIARSQAMEEEIATAAILKLRTAFQAMRDGVGTDEDFDKLGAALNTGLMRAEAIDPAVVDAIKAAMRALEACDEIRGAHGRYGFRGPDLALMDEGLDVYEQILRNSTPQQMQDAMRESLRRMQQQVAQQKTNH